MDATLVAGSRARAARSAGAALPGLTFALAGTAVLQGGYWRSQAVLSAALFGALAVAAGRWASDRGVLRGLALIVTGVVASALATGTAGPALGPLLVLVIAASAYALARRIVRDEGTVVVVEAVTGVGALVAGLGLVGVAWHVEPLGLHADTWRLASTLTYQNAAGSLLAMTLPAAIAAAAWRGTRASRVLLVVIGIALSATLSRGGFLSAGVTVAWLAGARVLRLGDVARPAVGVALGAVAMLPATLGWNWSAPIATVGVVLAVWIGSGDPWHPSRRLATVAAAVLAGVLIVILLATPLGDRFTFSGTDRGRVWSHTVRQAVEHPWFGTGPGTYRLVAPAGEQLVVTRHAHNEYLQWFSETGVIGSLSMLAGLVVIATSVRRHRRGRGLVRTAAVAAIAGFAVHAAVDFVWHVPVLVAIAAVLLAVATAERGER